ncbi:MAG: glutamate synthase-related protein [bacterium]
MKNSTVESRFENCLGRFVVARSEECIACGTCILSCHLGVHGRKPGFNRMTPPRNFLCEGPSCAEKETSCVAGCPRKALSVSENRQLAALGDSRWPPDMILAVGEMARTGKAPENGPPAEKGASFGGFDLMDFIFPSAVPKIEESAIDLSIPLNRRGAGEEIVIPIPIYGGGMSFGSISLTTMLARAMAAKELGTFTSTGEGGYPEELVPYADHIITQIATGLFGVREETIKRSRIVEFKYAQGAKPGLGGHLLGDKVTERVAEMRQSVPGRSLFSPFPFHSVYSVEDHLQHLDWIKAIHPGVLISVKVSTPSDVDMVAVGSYYAGAHIIHIDGGYGGTGAAPDIAKKNIAMPIEYAIPKAHQFLVNEGIREEVVLMASGGIRTPHDIAKAIALGADGVIIGTAELIALECVRCGNCESGRGCPRGIATTDLDLEQMMDSEWGHRRLVNLYTAYAAQLRSLLKKFGLKSIRELRGKMNLLSASYEPGKAS